MTLKERFEWRGTIANRRESILHSQQEITSGAATDATYYLLVGKAQWYAIESFIEGDTQKATDAANLVVRTALDYFYGSWRKSFLTPEGTMGGDAWKPFCLWYEEVMQSLPWACALGDWEAVGQIADYPSENKIPEAAKSRGEAAWAWALIYFLRKGSVRTVKDFLTRAQSVKAKRPKLLCPVLRALMEGDNAVFEKCLITYLVYYRQREFRLNLNKILALDGSTLYHLGLRQGFTLELPENLAVHVIRFT